MRALILTALLLICGCSKEKNPAGPGDGAPQAPNPESDTVALPYALSRPLVMVPVPAGAFLMGSIKGSDEQPLRSVTLSAFKMATTDVTQEMYQAVMGVNPSYFSGDTSRLRPVEYVTWYDAVLFCNALSRAAGRDSVYAYTAVTGTPGDGCSDLAGIGCDASRNGFRLPTEAEWEYACRAGSTADYYWGGSYPLAAPADTADMDSNAVWSHNSPNMTLPVGSARPNAWGLYDMSGNVLQWCNDWYGPYPGAAQTDPAGPAGGSLRVLRGGSYYLDDNGYTLRSACRGSMSPDARYRFFNVTGFRVVRRP
jgi:formylglycine-generating enzyme required for sulfatase activity